MDAVNSLQIAGGWLFPNAVMQYAVPQLEKLSIDVPALQAKRDRLVSALREMGYEVTSPEGTFYLWPRSPIPDDEAFVAELERRGVLVMPGALFETPGWFRICLTATAESIEAALPHFAAALKAVGAEPSGQAERSPLGTSL
jgi:aspartate aminotransferase